MMLNVQLGVGMEEIGEIRIACIETDGVGLIEVHLFVDLTILSIYITEILPILMLNNVIVKA
jgi:hypothetical protein